MLKEGIWTKSSRSVGEGDCLEVNVMGETVSFGDDKLPNWQSPENILTVSREVYAAFIGDVALGRFDIPAH